MLTHRLGLPRKVAEVALCDLPLDQLNLLSMLFANSLFLRPSTTPFSIDFLFHAPKDGDLTVRPKTVFSPSNNNRLWAHAPLG